MENERNTIPPAANGESSMSEPGPLALSLFAVAFFGFVICAGGVIVSSITAIVGGLVLTGASLAWFILRPTAR